MANATISDRGIGTPVNPVLDNAPTLYLADAGVPIVISELGAPFVLRGYSAWSPKDLFLNGEQGSWFDPSDLSTMFQDAAGEIPVTSGGDSIGRMNDKSGNGYAAIQAATTSHPVYETDGSLNWVQFDGVDDSLTVQGLDLSGTNEITVIAGLAKSDERLQCIMEYSININANLGSWYIFAGEVEPRKWSTISRGTQTISPSQAAYNATPAPDTAIFSALHSIPRSRSEIRRNGVLGTPGVGSKGEGNFGLYDLFIGRRGGAQFPFLGRIYGLIIVDRWLDDDDLTKAESWMASRTGVSV